MGVTERLGEHMGLWTKEQLRAFIKENKLVTAQDVTLLEDAFENYNSWFLSPRHRSYILFFHQEF
jgi:hypothetical protein